MSSAAPPLTGAQERDALLRREFQRGSLQPPPSELRDRLLQHELDQRRLLMQENAVEDERWRQSLERAADARARQLGIPRNHEEENRAFWKKVLDVIQTGNYASAGLALAIRRGDPHVWRGIIQGIQKRTTYQDVAQSLGVGGVAGFTLGLIGDIFLDPLTYLPGFGILAKTAKGRAFEKIAPELANIRRAAKAAGKVLSTEQEAKALRPFVERLSPREAKIVQEALREGERIHIAQTLPERVAQGTQRALTFEKPVGVYKIKKIPTPLIKFETAGTFGGTRAVGTGGFDAFAKLQVRGAEALSAAGKTITRLPKVGPALDFAGRLFNQWHRPAGVPPYIWQAYVESVQRFLSRMEGRKAEFLAELDKVVEKGGTAKDFLNAVGLKEQSFAGNPIHDIFQDWINRGMTREMRRDLLNTIEDPGRMLVGGKADLGAVIITDVLKVGLQRTDFQRAVFLGDPESISRLLAKAKKPELDAMEEQMVRGVRIHEDALEAIRRGKQVDPEEIQAIEQDLGNLRKGLEQVREARTRLEPPEPPPGPPPGRGGPFPPGPPPRPVPRPLGPPASLGGLSPDVRTAFGRIADVEALREGLKTRYDTLLRRARRLQAVAPEYRSAEDISRLRGRFNEIVDEMNKTRARYTALNAEIDMVRGLTERATQEGLRANKQVVQEIAKIQSRPAMRLKAVDILPEAQAELKDAQETYQIAKGAGDPDTQAQALEQVQVLGAETLARRAARVARERGMTPEQHRDLLQGYLEQGRTADVQRLEAEAAARAAELRKLVPPEQVTPPVATASPVEKLAAALRLEPKDIEDLARELSPAEFERGIRAQLGGAEEAYRIGQVDALDLRRLHREIRESKGLPPSDLRAQLTDIGRSEPEVLGEAGNVLKSTLNEIRKVDPHIEIDVENLHVIGPWARGEAKPNEPLEVMFFFRGEADEDALGQALAKSYTLPAKPGALPLDYQITPYKVPRGKTEADVLRAFGVPIPKPGLPVGRASRYVLTPEKAGPDVADALAFHVQPRIRPEALYKEVEDQPIVTPARDRFSQGLREFFKMQDDDIDLHLELTDARARAWAAVRGREPAEWYETRIGDVKEWNQGTAHAAIMMNRDSRAIIFAMNKPTFSSVLHELGHLFRRDLEGTDKKLIEKWVGVRGGKWSDKHEEKFARAFERYLRTGKAPIPKLEAAFLKFRDWIKSVYGALTNPRSRIVNAPYRGGTVAVNMNDEVIGVFDRLLGRTLQRPDVATMNRELEKARDVVDDAINLREVVRGSSTLSHRQVHVKKILRMGDRVQEAKRSLKAWEKKYARHATNIQMNEFDRLNYELGRVEPERWKIGGPTPKEAAKKEAGKPRRRKATTRKGPTPITKKGDPVVNTRAWPAEAKEISGINVENFESILEKHKNLIGTWTLFRPNGEEVQMETDKLLGLLKKAERGEGQVLRKVTSAKGKVSYERPGRIGFVQFFPNTREIEIHGAAGEQVIAQVNLPLLEEKLPRAVRMAKVEGITARTFPSTLAEGGEVSNVGARKFSGIDDVGLALKQQFGQHPLFRMYRLLRERALWAKKEPLRSAVDYEQWAENAGKINEEINGLLEAYKGLEAVTRAAKPEQKIISLLREYLDSFGFEHKGKPLKITPADVGLNFEPPGGKIQAKWKPTEFARGEIVKIDGEWGIVTGVSKRTAKTRSVTLESGRVVKMHVKDLNMASLKEVSENDESVIDALLKGAQREDGTMDTKVLRDSLDEATQDSHIRREIASEVVDNLLIAADPELLSKRQVLVDMLDKMFTNENQRGLLESYIYFYAPRIVTRETNKYKWLFKGRAGINVTREFFMKPRSLQEFIDTINESAQALGFKKLFEEDAIQAVALRGLASIRATETYDFVAQTLSRFGLRLSELVPLDEEGEKLRELFSASLQAGVSKKLFFRFVRKLSPEQFKALMERRIPADALEEAGLTAERLPEIQKKILEAPLPEDFALEGLMLKVAEDTGDPGVVADMKKRIDEARSLIKELRELEGNNLPALLERGRALAREPADVQRNVRRRIQALRNRIEEIAPEWGVYVPRGALAKFAGNPDDVRIVQDLLERGEIDQDQFAEFMGLVNGKWNKEGDQLVQVPITRMWAMRVLNKRTGNVFILPAAVADHMNGHMGAWTNIGEDLQPFIRLFDKVQNWWKAYTLSIYPVYHIRNTIGNIWNSWLAGAYDPDRWWEGFKLQSGKLTDFTDYWGRHLSQQELERMLTDLGIVERGFVASEAIDVLKARFPEHTSRIRRAVVPSHSNLWLRAGMRFGRRIENHARISLFLDGLKRGLTPDEAARRVRRYLFDYQALTTFEREINRRIFPFYTWSRFNIPLQLRHLITRPAKFTGAKKGIENIEKAWGGEQPDNSLIPDWMRDNTPIRVRQVGPEKYQYFLLGSWLPAADLIRAFQPASLAGGMLTPLLKAPFEWATNYSLFLQGQVERFPRETGDFLGLQLNKQEINMLRNLRFLNQADKFWFKEDLGLGGRIIQQSLGKLYPLDFEKARDFKAYRLNREASAVKASLRREQGKLEQLPKEPGLHPGEAQIRGAQLKRNIKRLEQDLEGLEAERRRIHRGSLPRLSGIKKLPGLERM